MPHSRFSNSRLIQNDRGLFWFTLEAEGPTQARKHAALLLRHARQDDFITDDIGVEIATLEEMKREASEAMADLAKDVLPGSVGCTLAIEVRDDSGPVLRVNFAFEIEHIRAHSPRVP